MKINATRRSAQTDLHDFRLLKPDRLPSVHCACSSNRPDYQTIDSKCREMLTSVDRDISISWISLTPTWARLPAWLSGRPPHWSARPNSLTLSLQWGRVVVVMEFSLMLSNCDSKKNHRRRALWTSTVIQAVRGRPHNRPRTPAKYVSMCVSMCMFTFCENIADFIAALASFLAFLTRCIALEAVFTTLEVKHAALQKKKKFEIFRNYPEMYGFDNSLP